MRCLISPILPSTGKVYVIGTVEVTGALSDLVANSAIDTARYLAHEYESDVRISLVMRINGEDLIFAWRETTADKLDKFSDTLKTCLSIFARENKQRLV